MAQDFVHKPTKTGEKPAISYLQYLYIEDDGRTAKINGENCYSLSLPSKWQKASDLADGIYRSCQEYDLDYVNEENVDSRIREAIANYSQRNNHSIRHGFDQVEKPADILYQIAQQEITMMFRDRESKAPYAILNVDGATYAVNMESVEFRLKLRILYENRIRSDPSCVHSPLISEQELNKVVQQLLARNDKLRNLSLRCLSKDNVIYYDFMNEEYQYAVITQEGYTVHNDGYLLFKRYDDHHAQALPDTQSSDGEAVLDNVIKSFNIMDNEYGDKNLLFKVGLMALFFRPTTRITMPIWTVNGPPGSSKTSLLLLLKSLVDPLNGNPKSMVNSWGREDQKRDRGLTVSKNYFVIFDNLSHLSDSESDELCIYSTGGRHEERKLHTNVDSVSYELQGNIGYTSINDIAKQSDLISRQLKFELEMRTENISESAFWRKVEMQKPAILHYIFTTIGRAIPIYSQLTENPACVTSHRLADFILLCEAISRATGQPAGRIQEMFKRIEQEQAERSIDNSSFASFFADCILNRVTIRGREVTLLMKEIFDTLKEHALATNPNIQKDMDFPANPIQLGRKIERIRPSLQKLGIEIKKIGRSNKGFQYKISIKEKLSEQDTAQRILPLS